MPLKNFTALSLALVLPNALSAMESHTNVARVGYLRSVLHCSFDAGITENTLSLTPAGEGKYGPYNLKVDWLSIDWSSDAIPTAEYTVTAANNNNEIILSGKKEITPGTITFIQIDSEKRCLYLWACKDTSIISMDDQRYQEELYSSQLESLLETS